MTIVFFLFFVSSGQRELSDEFNTKLNLDNQNEASDEKMHMDADYSSSSDDSDSDAEEEEELVIVSVCNTFPYFSLKAYYITYC